MRAGLHAMAGGGAFEAAARRFQASVPCPPGAAVALSWPLAGEFDTRPLMARLDQAGHPCALPVAEAPGRPLRFRAWWPGMTLKPGRFGVQEPDEAAPEIIPDIVVLPCLAFDRAGFRLGYGAGYYDRTLAALRAGSKPVIGVLLGFAGQERARVPREAHDEPADWIVTEDFAIPSEREP